MAIASSGTLGVCHHKREVRSGGLIKSRCLTHQDFSFLSSLGFGISVLYCIFIVIVFLSFCHHNFCHHKREVRSGGLIKSTLPDVSPIEISLFSAFLYFIVLYFCLSVIYDIYVLLSLSDSSLLCVSCSGSRQGKAGTMGNFLYLYFCISLLMCFCLCLCLTAVCYVSCSPGKVGELVRWLMMALYLYLYICISVFHSCLCLTAV